MYAAKHLSSDYVKSLPLPDPFEESVLAALSDKAFQHMYDTGTLDPTLVHPAVESASDGKSD
ncbi:hypothetical protein H310_02719 [Aphanomyces invadans]|uniref:Uncharacterized protein n=1 Tax=Aphanomyces invadans TaxID=157072 RepID=A0A024ULJ3_9STRA|nr:hypothetical protein H310_02719 [Aphanomyces invadans]ETW06463.1 hypothetical protein H310_02719 [Aphanomyces invadans]|eukprot:XP_008864538.1 hypothetical protein H310_02719 [Aphanomyces invadans]